MNYFLETRRLILRDMRQTDVDGMFELDSNREVHKYLGNKPIKTKVQSEAIIEQVRNQYKKFGIGRWAVIEKLTGDFTGWSGLKFNTEEEFNGHTNFYDIGYRLIPRYWNKGYATESSKVALQYAFNTMKLEIVNGITEIGNMASHKVLLKIGMQHTEDFDYPKENLKLRWYELKAENYD